MVVMLAVAAFPSVVKSITAARSVATSPRSALERTFGRDAAIVGHTRDYLDRRLLVLGEVLWDSDFSLLDTFHEHCDHKGLTMALIVTDRGPRVGIASMFTNRSEGPQGDSNAAICSNAGCFPVAPGRSATLFSPRRGPVWGADVPPDVRPAVTTFERTEDGKWKFSSDGVFEHESYPGSRMGHAEDGAATVSHVKIVRVVPYAPAASRRHDSLLRPPRDTESFADELVERMHGLPEAVVSLAGGAGTGKSTLLNALGSTVAGQVTRTTSTSLMYVRPSRATVDGLLFENMTILSGEPLPPTLGICTRGGAKPRVLLNVASQSFDGAALRAAEPVLTILVADASTLFSGTLPESARILANMRRLAESTDVARPLPVIVVITKVELWFERFAIDDIPPEILLDKENGPLRPLFRQAEMKLGVPPADVFALGWLAGGRSFRNVSDPVVQVLQELLLRAAGCVARASEMEHTQAAGTAIEPSTGPDIGQTAERTCLKHVVLWIPPSVSDAISEGIRKHATTFLQDLEVSVKLTRDQHAEAAPDEVLVRIVPGSNRYNKNDFVTGPRTMTMVAHSTREGASQFTEHLISVEVGEVVLASEATRRAFGAIRTMLCAP